MNSLKINSFKYIVNQLLRMRIDGASFSRTQLLKLLFFVSAVKVNGRDLLDIFDNYYAMQFGPVESDVFNAMNNEGIDYIHFQIDGDTMKRIDDALYELNSRYPSLFKRSASELVEISHKWSCWRDAYAFADFMGKGSVKMGVEQIRKSNQVFE